MTPRSRFLLAAALAVETLSLTTAGSAAPLQICTAQTTQGFPISGTVCGGTTYGFQCSAGVIYKCRSGARFARDNCTLS